MTALHSGDQLDAALSVQLQLKQVWESAGEPAGGWKVGFTTGDPSSPSDNRKKLPEDYRPFGFVLASRILESGSEISRALIQSCQLEPEIYLRIGEPLGGTVSVEQARAAVDRVGPAFEINEGRYVAKANPLPVRFAAGLNNWGMIVGPGIDPPDQDVRSTTVTVTCGGEVEATTSRAFETFDDPFVSLSRLCARLDHFGLALNPGDHVITGAFSHHKVDASETWRASFSNIGDVSVTFSD